MCAVKCLNFDNCNSAVHHVFHHSCLHVGRTGLKESLISVFYSSIVSSAMVLITEVCVYVRLCVRERERERERDGWRER